MPWQHIQEYFNGVPHTAYATHVPPLAGIRSPKRLRQGGNWLELCLGDGPRLPFNHVIVSASEVSRGRLRALGPFSAEAAYYELWKMLRYRTD